MVILLLCLFFLIDGALWGLIYRRRVLTWIFCWPAIVVLFASSVLIVAIVDFASFGFMALVDLVAWAIDELAGL